MGVGLVVSVVLFSNQAKYVGPVPKALPDAGDLTPVVGFVLAAALYAVLYRAFRQPVGPAPTGETVPASGVTR
jgi:hypothetical protein